MLVHPDSFDGTIPQPVTFSFTPQRYTPDSMVLSRVSFDRVDRGRVPRMMPEALDATWNRLAPYFRPLGEAPAEAEPAARRRASRKGR